MNELPELEALLSALEPNAAKEDPPDGATQSAGDAIDAVLAAPARTTAVRSLRESPEVARFRQEAVDGFIRVDTAGKLLSLVADVVARVLAGGAV